MDVFVLDDVLSRLRAALEDNDLTGAVAVIESLQPADQADLVEGLSDVDQVALLSSLAPSDSADVLEEMKDREAAALAELLPIADLAGILNEMEADEAADVLGDLPPERAAEALREMDEPGEIIPLLQYPDDTAGGLMTPAIITLRQHWRAERALQELRSKVPDVDSAYYLFVTDEEGVLLGVVALRDLVVAVPETTVEAMMDRAVISVPVTADQELCARTVSRYGFLMLPVIDKDLRLVGVITADDLIEVAEDEATEDMYRMVGISGDEQVLGPLSASVLRRLPWLAVNMVTLFIAISVVNAFEPVIAGMVALATFLPLVSGEGGNAGSQT
ncbi:magnesium transporter, partial [Chloroflexota bacterium]